MIPGKINVEIWSDVTCVHCYMAKRHFEKALSAFKHRDQVSIVWRSFELAPGLVPEPGKSMYQFLADYNGATFDQVKNVCGQITRDGQRAGIHFNFETAIPANSFLAHQFSHLTAEHQVQHEAKEALFKAHFTDGLDINSVEVLKRIASSIGMDPRAVDELARSARYADAVVADERAAREKKINAVPYYLFNSTHSISGAKDASTFLSALEKCYPPELSTAEGDTCEIGKAC